MGNDELQKLWKNFEIKPKPKEELNILLTSKARAAMNKLFAIRIFSILVCLGLLTFLAFATYNRITDKLYLANNILLATLTLVALFSGLISLSNFQNYRYDVPLQNWLEYRIKKLSGILEKKVKWLLPLLVLVLFILVQFSIHVYYEDKLMKEVFASEESLTGLIFGTAIGLAVSYYGAIKVRKVQSDTLEFLRDLHKRLLAD